MWMETKFTVLQGNTGVYSIQQTRIIISALNKPAKSWSWHTCINTMYERRNLHTVCDMHDFDNNLSLILFNVNSSCAVLKTQLTYWSTEHIPIFMGIYKCRPCIKIITLVYFTFHTDITRHLPI